MHTRRLSFRSGLLFKGGRDCFTREEGLLYEEGEGLLYEGGEGFPTGRYETYFARREDPSLIEDSMLLASIRKGNLCTHYCGRG